MDRGQPKRQTSNYVRHGTLDLFAALNVATGEVLARCTRQHRAQDFVAFLRKVEASVDPTVDVHVVLDNLSAHKAPPVQRSLPLNSHAKTTETRHATRLRTVTTDSGAS